MSTLDGSLRRHAALAACLTLLFVLPVAAQQPIAAPTTPDFFSRYDFNLSAAHLGIDDPRFVWDTHFGGEVDLFDYVYGRTSVLMDYNAVLGNQRREFDPIEGNYTLEATTSGRLGKTEIALMFHHVSRHLGDREKPFQIAWNVLGVRVLRHEEKNKTTIDMRADIGSAVQHVNVDYQWVADADVRVRHRINRHVGVFVRGSGRWVGVDEAVSSRGTQYGAEVEGGLRLFGGEGVLELFAGFERQIDADPVDVGPQQWFLAGFRFVRH